MFNSMLESSVVRKNGRRRYFIATALFYLSGVGSLLVLTIMLANPTTADNLRIDAFLAPPVIAAAAPRQVIQRSVETRAPHFVPPADVRREIPNPTTIPSIRKPSDTVIYLPGAADTGGFNSGGQGPGLPVGETVDNAPPPVRPTPTPKPVEQVTPAVPRTINQSTGVLVGRALNKPQPAYPAIAKAAHIQGPVNIQITIAEDGRVLDAQTVSGHPLLSEAARKAALLWTFTPTRLSGNPVKVTGVITFNFTLAN